MEGAIRPLFIFTDDGKTNKSIVMPNPNFRSFDGTRQLLAYTRSTGESQGKWTIVIRPR